MRDPLPWPQQPRPTRPPDFIAIVDERIVLAQRTGDHTQLKRARPVLQRLGDRQFLRRLEEVAATLR